MIAELICVVTIKNKKELEKQYGPGENELVIEFSYILGTGVVTNPADPNYQHVGFRYYTEPTSLPVGISLENPVWNPTTIDLTGTATESKDGILTIDLVVVEIERAQDGTPVQNQDPPPFIGPRFSMDIFVEVNTGKAP